MTGIIPFTSAKTIECGLHYRMSQLDDLQSEILDTDECEYDKLNPKLLEIASAISELVKVNGAAAHSNQRIGRVLAHCWHLSRTHLWPRPPVTSHPPLLLKFRS